MRESGISRLSTFHVPRTEGTYLTRKPLLLALQKAIATYAKGKVLDIGCGNKPYKPLFNNISEYIGCDIVQSDQQAVDVICEANKIPLESETFDTVFSTQTIEHVFDHQGLVSEAFRLLKSNGYFIVSGPMYWPLHEEPYDFFRFTKYGFTQLMTKAGFEVVEVNENGGKWALLGQVLIHVLPTWLLGFRPIRLIHNSFFEMMDRISYVPSNTTNYVVIVRKP